MAKVKVYLEVTDKRVFAVAPEWPGWSRVGRDEEAALQALRTYAGRYAKVARHAGLEFSASPDLGVVARVDGDASTSFGVPGRRWAGDLEGVSPASRKRQIALLQACWEVLDEAIAGSPQVLRKGPRGGGRDRDKMVEHVLEAEGGYARYMGLKLQPPSPGDATAIRRHRQEILATLEEADQAAEGPDGGKRWPFTYMVRRMAWHALDHAWEMEDRREPAAR